MIKDPPATAGIKNRELKSFFSEMSGNKNNNKTAVVSI